MTANSSFSEDELGNLSDNEWRRLGVTQTFEKLLVEAAATRPGPAADVAGYAGRSMSGGAAKFWELSVGNLQRDLCRKRILVNQGGQLNVHPEFADRMGRLLESLVAGHSHVAPTPGATVESIMEQAAQREKQQKPTSTRAKTKKTSTPSPQATPKMRSPSADAPAATVATQSSAVPSFDLTPKKLFTSKRVNRLFDCLDNNALSKAQLGSRLELSGLGLDRFLEVNAELELVRVSRDDLVELHWRGREAALTSGADRRMAVLDLVDDLRSRASEPTTDD